MTDGITERARELGRLIGQTNEFQALGRARQRLTDDEPTMKSLNRIAELEAELSQVMQRGEEPAEATKTAYESAFSELQGSAIYQGVVAAQSNFDRILSRVNDEITKGMEAATQSRIILPS